MTFRQFLYVLRRWRSIVAAGAVIGVVVGWLSAPGTAATTTFEATNTVILDREAGDGSVYQAAAVAALGAVPTRVAAQLHLDPQFVSEAVSVYPRVFGVIYITARTNDRSQAEALANLTAKEVIAEFGGQNSPFRTVEPAVASPIDSGDIEAPRSRPGRAVLLGAFGLLLGVGAAFGVDRFDNRIRSRRTTEETLGVPVVAEVPPIPRSARGRLVTPTHAGPVLEAYRSLGTAVLRWAPPGRIDDGHRVIVVTSPGADQGKTTTVAHLAVTLAEIGHSVLAVSADLRRPALQHYFDRSRDPGLVDVLRDTSEPPTLAAFDLATGIRGVQFLASGPPIDNPAPVLDRAGDLMWAASASCDFVLIDSPPLLSASDASVLAQYADGVLLVVRAGRVSVGAARRSAELLERLGVPLIGAVLVAG